MVSYFVKNRPNSMLKSDAAQHIPL